MAEPGETPAPSGPKATYMSQCSVCHGDKMPGAPPAIPSLIGIAGRLRPDQITATIKSGKGRMPGFRNLSGEPLIELVDFLTNGESKELGSVGPEFLGMKYRFLGYRRFLDPEGYPAIAPPWGALNAINLSTGEYAWRIHLGEYPELAAQGLKNTGTENYGGANGNRGRLPVFRASRFFTKIH